MNSQVGSYMYTYNVGAFGFGYDKIGKEFFGE